MAMEKILPDVELLIIPAWPIILPLRSKWGVLLTLDFFDNSLWKWEVKLRRSPLGWEMQHWNKFCQLLDCVQIRSNARDCLVWNESKSGIYSPKVFMEWILPTNMVVEDIWKMSVPTWEANTPAMHNRRFDLGANRGELERENRPPAYGQNWGSPGQNWWSHDQSNAGVNNVASRGPPSYGNHGFNPFGYCGNGPNEFNGPNFSSGSHGRAFDIGHRSFGPHPDGDFWGHPYGGLTSRPRGPSGSVRSRSNDDHILPRPSANCVNVDRSWQTVHEAPWRTKPRARVFSVDSSPKEELRERTGRRVDGRRGKRTTLVVDSNKGCP
ncbi:hypothetical protein GOBAR_AA05824 [Gossypium barbadense]|uniref:Uncharacterized protein n=1 Tax=Gossypium barbadense TaxID=3634 RepID=A0A2P5YGS0_GOSBA|nr:hypothetical protein GOBAR_AA05824 [Gossypium barbadense]